jgi:hypothetical protein
VMRLGDISSYDEAEERRPPRTARMLAETRDHLLSSAKEPERSALLSGRRKTGRRGTIWPVPRERAAIVPNPLWH